MSQHSVFNVPALIIYRPCTQYLPSVCAVPALSIYHSCTVFAVPANLHRPVAVLRHPLLVLVHLVLRRLLLGQEVPVVEVPADAGVHELRVVQLDPASHLHELLQVRALHQHLMKQYYVVVRESCLDVHVPVFDQQIPFEL